MPSSTSMGGRSAPSTHCAAATGICEMAKKALSKSAPSKIKKIMAVADAVSSAASTMPCQVSSRMSRASAPVAMVPMAAASVGVKMPP